MPIADLTNDTRIPDPPIGWPLLPVPDDDGALSYPDGLADSVRQQLQTILSTRLGEQLMRPTFGAGLTDFLGEQDTIATRKRVYDRVSDAIGLWEPRVTVDRIDVDAVPNRPGWLHIQIAYRLRRTGSPMTLGVNLEL
jgi:hypothetical protein